MADVIETKRISDLTENTEMVDTDLFLVGNAGTSTFRKVSWDTIVNAANANLKGNYVLKAVTDVDYDASTAIAANKISSTISVTFTKVSNDAICVPVFIGGGWLTCAGCGISGNKLSFTYATWSTGSHTGTLHFKVLQFVPAA